MEQRNYLVLVPAESNLRITGARWPENIITDRTDQGWEFVSVAADQDDSEMFLFRRPA